jgi:protocatechuate 3,4-dioxygenase beta subunit
VTRFRILVLGALLAVAGARLARGAVLVSGRAVTANGAPIASALVYLEPIVPHYEAAAAELTGAEAPKPAAEAASDTDGVFRLTTPSAGMFRVVVVASGFVPVEQQLAPLLEDTELPDATLTADAGLEVVVLAASGKPLAGARVRALAQDAPPGRRFFDEGAWQPALRAGRTDEKGRLSLPRAESERVAIRAVGAGFREAEREGVRGSRVELRLQAASEERLEVRDARGTPVSEVLVFAGATARLGESRWAVARTGADGRAAVALPVGSRRVQLLARDGRVFAGTLPPPVEGTVRLTLADVPRHQGRVIDAENRQPVPEALVWAAGDPGSVTRADNRGAYQAAAPEGRVALRAAAAGYAEAFLWATDRAPVFALEPRVALRGRVVDEAGRPVPRVEVSAVAQRQAMLRLSQRSRDRLYTRTGAEGGFRLAGAPPGVPLTLRATRAGFAPARLEVDPLPPDGGPEVRLVLERGRVARGRVLDGRGRPVAAAEVTLERAPESRGQRFMPPWEENGPPLAATSDAAGGFEFRHLPSERYDLAARARGFAPLSVPGVVVPAGAGAFDLGTLVLEPGAMIEGRVVEMGGTPIAEAEVRVRSSDPMQAVREVFGGTGAPPAAVSAADGWFTVPDRRAGDSVELAIERPGFAAATVPGVEVPTVEPVVVVLHPASNVSGRVVDPEGKPLAGARVVLSLSITVGGGFGRSMRSGGDTLSDEEGRFTFERIGPGRASVMAWLAGWQSGGTNELDVPRGRDLAGVEVVLQPGAAVAGQVFDSDGRPVVGARVELVDSQRGPERMSFATETDGDGHYRLEGVPLGVRTVGANHDDRRRAVAELDVRPGDNALDLRFQGGVEVTGRVVDETGGGVAGAGVRLGSAGAFFGGPQTVSGAEGAFAFTGVRAGGTGCWRASRGTPPPSSRHRRSSVTRRSPASRWYCAAAARSSASCAGSTSRTCRASESRPAARRAASIPARWVSTAAIASPTCRPETGGCAPNCAAAAGRPRAG